VKIRSYRPAFAAIILSLIGSAFSSHINSTSIYAFSNDLSGEPNHENITREALSFLTPTILNDIDGEHYQADTAYAAFSEYHFDGCEFRGSSEKINELYTDLILSLNPNSPDLENAPDAFGLLLHPVQDFYAHSNWIELGMPGIVDDGNNFWHELQPWELRKGVVIIQGEQIPEGIKLSRNGAVVRATIASPLPQPHGVFPALLTGTFGPDSCPDSISLSHSRLNKDDTSRPNHFEARARAVLQTTHEWCRLVNLVQARYGNAGVEFLFKNWVADESAASSVCATGVDIALIIDSTGSMVQNDPQGIRREATKAFIDASSPGDRISIISFSSSASNLAFMRTIISDTDKEFLKQAVDGVGSSGSTNVNAALNAGFRSLQSSTSINPKAAILLTDGDHTDGQYRDISHQQYRDEGWPVYTIGLNASSAASLLQRIASDTNGEYNALADSSQLQTLYFDISQRVSGGLMVASQQYTMNQGESRNLNAEIPEGSTTATFFTTWPGSEVTMTLVSPTGQRFTSTSEGKTVYHAKSLTYEIFKLRGLEAGTWTIEIYGNVLAQEGEVVQVRAAVTGVKRIYLPISNS
jgi:Mg-chelatase subunit ChlD